LFDLRYHITTLVAIFLALAIGILVGTTMVSDQLLVEQQKQMIDRLEDDFVALREQNRESKEEMAVFQTATDNYQQFADKVYPLIVSGRLAGVQAAIVITGEANYSDLVGSLSLSGLDINPVISISKDSESISADKEGKLKDKVTVKLLAQQLGHYLLSGDLTEPLEKWKQMGLYDIHKGFESQPNVVILVGGSQEEKDVVWIENFDIPLINEVMQNEKAVIGTEYSKAAFSYIPYYQMEGISTVDDIDLVLGQAALVFLLEGRPGHYGIKSSAKSIMPEIY